MSEPVTTLRALFDGMQQNLHQTLTTSTSVILHPGAKGTATEVHWAAMLTEHLPNRYAVKQGFVIDHQGRRSDQIDIILYDPHFSPLLFEVGGICFVPAESVYAVFEVKQDISRSQLKYASEKIESVRRLERTSAPFLNGGHLMPGRKPPPIIGGFLALKSTWRPALGETFQRSVLEFEGDGRVDLGCVLTQGAFETATDDEGVRSVNVSDPDVALISFFLSLLSALQRFGTVPAINYPEYATAFSKGLG